MTAQNKSTAEESFKLGRYFHFSLLVKAVLIVELCYMGQNYWLNCLKYGEIKWQDKIYSQDLLQN